MNIDGKELRITPPSFDDAMDLKDAIEIAIKSGKLDLKFDINDIKDISDNDFGEIAKLILSVDSSKEIRNCLFKCASRAVLGTDKIDREFFESIENRKHYYKIMIEVIKVSLSPFFESLFSSFSGIKEKINNILNVK